MFKKIFAIILLSALFSACVPSPVPTSGITLRVFDGMSGRPLPGARVVVPETGGEFFTDRSGCTEGMLLPVVHDSEYDRLLKSPSGRITFIVYADGYTPYLLLYARTGEDRAIDVNLFPDDGTLPVFTVIEAPSPEWARELVERYK
ncbi:MAG: carboxypeptidase-like regulatory domain-containing protein [Clostridiales bacterium]|nr:carboxypeptidase-like regulatory domain-containing protein [Clostridiales bacterium]